MKNITSLNEENEFTMDFSIFNLKNQTNANNDDTSNNNIIIKMVIIGGVSVIICSILSGLIYLYYYNHMFPQEINNLMETITPLDNKREVDVSIGSECEFMGGQLLYNEV